MQAECVGRCWCRCSHGDVCAWPGKVKIPESPSCSSAASRPKSCHEKEELCAQDSFPPLLRAGRGKPGLAGRCQHVTHVTQVHYVIPQAPRPFSKAIADGNGRGNRYSSNSATAVHRCVETHAVENEKGHPRHDFRGILVAVRAPTLRSAHPNSCIGGWQQEVDAVQRRGARSMCSPVRICRAHSGGVPCLHNDAAMHPLATSKYLVFIQTGLAGICAVF